VPIDWFTVVAQAINFLILVWLLKHFLYGPIVRTMNEREDEIGRRRREAEEKLEDAKQRRESIAAERDEIDDERKRILKEAEEKAESYRQEKLEEAREAAEKRSEQSRKALERRADEMLDELVAHMNEQLVRALERALSEIADTALEEKTVSVFVARLGELDDETRDDLVSALNDESATVRTARELSDDQKQRVRDAVGALGASGDVSFEVDPELICGLALSAGGHRISWSLRSYVRSAEESLRAALHEATTRSEPSESEDGEGSENESTEGQRHAG
jgi:F-type H+-transporting ATPase subunit b